MSEVLNGYLYDSCAGWDSILTSNLILSLKDFWFTLLVRWTRGSGQRATLTVPSLVFLAQLLGESGLGLEPQVQVSANARSFADLGEALFLVEVGDNSAVLAEMACIIIITADGVDDGTGIPCPLGFFT